MPSKQEQAPPPTTETAAPSTTTYGITRRSLLSGAAAGAVASVLPASALAATRKIPLTRSEERVVVIGSGFGGGISALRLAQAGIPVLVLERGRWWKSGPNAETFPHATIPDKRDLFYSIWPEKNHKRVGISPYVGLLEPVRGKNITAICPAGVGGGSLVYQGMTVQPSEDVFSQWFPAGVDYQEMDEVYYRRVTAMLHAQTAPDALINSSQYRAARKFAANVQAAGYSLTKIPMPIDWNYALAELRGEMKQSYTNGDCALGVNNGGKFSVDVTYIEQALATGLVRVEAQHNVTSLLRAANGHWEIHVSRTNARGTVLEHKIITTPTLILAAGSINTTRLLVSAAARGDITDLPDGLGKGYGTNGDQIYLWRNPDSALASPQGGPVIYGSYDWSSPTRLANTVIQASIPPGSRFIGNTLTSSVLLPGAAALSRSAKMHATMLVGFGVSNGRGHFEYNAAKDRTDLIWPANGDAEIAKCIHERVLKIAGEGSKVINTNKIVNSTWHSLGGACIDVVCDLEGRVKGQRGLYVLDGALMPGTTCAANPSMTIAAMVERALDRIVRDDIGTII
ncbi:Putative cholesterol oxidase [gamma proteobacterium HdN1]|nr:Putative cholesterol oxidase [gamma proteobacterium HdN1]